MCTAFERLARPPLLAALAIVAFAACGSPEPAPAQDEEPTTRRTATAPASDSALASAIAVGEQQAVNRLPPGAGRDVVSEACLICHGAALIELQRKDRDGWTRTVSGMVDWGAPLSAEQEQVVVDYLAEHFRSDRGATP